MERICPHTGRFSYVTRDDLNDLEDLTVASTTDPEDDSDQLSVISIDLLKSKTGQNQLEHHTNLYENNYLIIRRGQTFQMWIELSREFKATSDKLHLELRLGREPTLSKGTLVTVSLLDKLEYKGWEAKLTEQKDTRIKLSVHTPPTAPIGRYKFSVKILTPAGKKSYCQKPENDIYLLFNPWCEDDSVFLDNEEERKEYILNEAGMLYYGNKEQIGARTWLFGQFAEGILEASLYLLEKSETFASGWGDPVNIVRVISAMVNSFDDQGVLVGNWSNHYSGGTRPTTWTGSVEILRQYHKSEGKPVKYGQCWVFAGVTNTVLRCLGIPCRSITNFSSAHDTDVSMTTDVYVDEKFNPIEKLSNDSIWNFHVWNECWMARPDLPDGMGGWQVVDATPQETSQGIFCCGPAPVVAIRDGLVFHKYDAPFVFAEVNSDRIFWLRQADETFTQIYTEKNVVGRNISTKAVGSDDREDITHLYKHPEGSAAERIAVETASQYGSKPNTYPSAAEIDVTLKIAVIAEGPYVGDDARLTFTLKNDSTEVRSIELHCQVAIMYYTGVIKNTLKRDTLEVTVQPRKVQTVEWTVSYDEYKDYLLDQTALMLTVCGRVNETQQILVKRFNFRLRTPDIIISTKGNAVVSQEMEAKITFRNPLPLTLKNVNFHIEGLGLTDSKEYSFGDISGLETVRFTVKFTPTLPGARKLVASLNCVQLSQVHGVELITVKEA